MTATAKKIVVHMTGNNNKKCEHSQTYIYFFSFRMKAEAVSAGLLREVEDIDKYDVIGIDEGQFVKKEIDKITQLLVTMILIWYSFPTSYSFAKSRRTKENVFSCLRLTGLTGASRLERSWTSSHWQRT